jgi:AcrR family transcriptional regulator
VSNVPATALDDVGATLLAAAAELLATHGPAALTVRRIAADAGMSTMNVYSRFGGKDGVVEHLYLRGFQLLAAGMDGIATTDDPLADLHACGQAYRRFALGHATLYSVMFDKAVPDFEPSPSAMSVAAHTLQQLADRIERVMRARGIHAGQSMHLAAIVWSTCHGVVSLELKHMGPPAIVWEDVFRDATESVLKGLGA